jgi:hypothetical protein
MVVNAKISVFWDVTYVLSWTDANSLEKPAISVFRAHTVPYTVKMEAAALSTEFALIYKTTQYLAKSEVPTVLMLRLVSLLGATIPSR